MRTYRIYSFTELPVVTEVVAESRDEALRVANQRKLGHDIDNEWILAEELISETDDVIYS